MPFPYSLIYTHFGLPPCCWIYVYVYIFFIYVFSLTFQILTAVDVNDVMFWDVTPWSFAAAYQRYEGTGCLHLQGWAGISIHQSTRYCLTKFLLIILSPSPFLALSYFLSSLCITVTFPVKFPFSLFPRHCPLLRPRRTCWLYRVLFVFVFSIRKLPRNRITSAPFCLPVDLFCPQLNQRRMKCGRETSGQSNVYWTVHHCNSWGIKNQLDVTCLYFTYICSTCFEH